LQKLELELHQPLTLAATIVEEELELAATIVEEELELWHHSCL
jgi:hypothetical protein